MYNSSAPKNALQQTLHKTAQEAGQPVNEQDRITYGIISKVNPDTSQVRVKLLKADGQAGEEIPGFFPLITPLQEVHLKFGNLREGLVVRIYWKGKLTPQAALVEVIGDEDHSFLKKQPMPNEIEIGPFKIFSGGLG